MNQSGNVTGPAPEDGPQGDPWHAFGYLVSGVAFYGALGWGADRWLGTTFLVAVGILVGAGLGLFLTFTRFRTTVPAEPGTTPRSTPRTAPSTTSDES